MVRLQMVEVKEISEKESAGRPNPRAKWARKTILSPASAQGTTSSPGSRHSTSAGILRARIKASTAPAETFEPFHHPRLAFERSGAWAAIGARGQRVEEEEDGE